MKIEPGLFNKDGDVVVVPSVWYIRELLDFLQQMEVIRESFADEADGKIVIELHARR